MSKRRGSRPVGRIRQAVRHALVVSLAGAALLPTAPGVAQPAPTLESLTVDLWPEYDRSAVLVMYRVALAPFVELPAQLQFRIPASAGTPNAVAERRPDGRLVEVPYERTVAGEQATIELTASTAEIQLEYYDSDLVHDGAGRSFRYVWPGDYAVQSLSVSVQQPAGAGSMMVEPAPDRTGPGADGLTYHFLTLDPASAGTTAAVTFVYQRTTDALTAETLPPPSRPAASPSAPAPTRATPATGPGVSLVLAAMVGIAALGILVAAFIARSRRGTARATQAPARSHGGSGFCTGCGARARPEERFCHACGKKLRRR